MREQTTEPDWTRERRGWSEWAPGKSLLRAHRRAQSLVGRRNPIARVRLRMLRIQLAFWRAVSGADVPLGAQLGGGLMLPHPNGVVIHRDAVVGVNCMIMQQVTIGQLAHGGVPHLGCGVYVGAGAKVLGRVTIGDGAAIGANAVVLCDVPAGMTAVGVPARVIARSRAEAASRDP